MGISPTFSPSASPTLSCVDDPNFRINGVDTFSCKWIAKKDTKKRCQAGKDALAPFKKCRATCDPACATPSPTTVPTVAPSFKPSSESNCLDVETFIRKNKEKTCEWAADLPIERCIKEDDSKRIVEDLCPSVCNYRCTCTNAKEPFDFRDRTKKCRRVKVSNGQCGEPAGKGLKKIVSDFCPKKCKSCYAKPLRITVPPKNSD